MVSFEYFIDNPSDRTMALGLTQPLTEMNKGKGKAIPEALRVPGG
jgi:hypothetical protein